MQIERARPQQRGINEHYIAAVSSNEMHCSLKRYEDDASNEAGSLAKDSLRRRKERMKAPLVMLGLLMVLDWSGSALLRDRLRAGDLLGAVAEKDKEEVGRLGG